MKVKQIKMEKTKDIKSFISKVMAKGEESHKNTLWFIIQISQVYEGTLRLNQLEKQLSDKTLSRKVSEDLEHPLHWKVSLVMIDCLLDSAIIISSGYEVLYDEYVEILQLIIKFSKDVLKLPATIVISMFLRKFKRVLEVTSYEER